MPDPRTMPPLYTQSHIPIQVTSGHKGPQRGCLDPYLIILSMTFFHLTPKKIYHIGAFPDISVTST